MLIPIGPIAPHCDIKGITRVRHPGKTPRFMNIPAESYNHYAFPVLGHPIVSGVYFLKNNSVAKAKLDTRCMMLFQPR